MGNNPQEFLETFGRPFTITAIALVLLGTGLLFINDLTPFLRDRLLPSLWVYTMGTGVIAYFHYLFWRRNHTATDGKPLPFGRLSIFVVLHAVWFMGFAGFNAWVLFR